MAWFGLNAVTQRNQFERMRERGFQAYTSYYIHRVGVEEAFRQLLDYVLDGVEHLYVTVDIDVVSGAHAPGTGAPSFAGLEAHELLTVMRMVGGVQELVGLDLSEVNPELDPTARTALLAANALMAALGPRLLERAEPVPPEIYSEVFVGERSSVAAS